MIKEREQRRPHSFGCLLYICALEVVNGYRQVVTVFEVGFVCFTRLEASHHSLNLRLSRVEPLHKNDSLRLVLSTSKDTNKKRGGSNLDPPRCSVRISFCYLPAWFACTVNLDL